MQSFVKEGELFLSERPSPDGGEAPTVIDRPTEDEGEFWDTWDPVTPEVFIL